MRQIQIHRSWIPGGWCNVENLECAEYYPHFARYLLNGYYLILRGIEAVSRRDELFDEFGTDDKIFVRPSCVHKLFAGRIVHIDEFRDAIAPSRYDPETRVVVSSPKTLGREWRLVIADDSVIASSLYRDQGAITATAGCPAEVSHFAERVLLEVNWRPDKVFMMDVCESSNGLRILELNSFSCSGLYDCDLPAVIHSTSDIAAREWQTTMRTNA